MAFDIMSLFSPSAVNRMLQPAQNANGVQNFLVNPQAAIDALRFGGTDRLPAVGIDALRERMQPQLPVNGSASATSGVSGDVAGTVGMDPWAGMRQAQVDQMPVASTQPVAQQTGKTGGFGGIDKALLNDIFLGWAMGQTPMQSLSLGAAQMAKGRGERGNRNETVEWLKKRGMDEGSARQMASNPTVLADYLKQINTPADPMKDLQRQKMELEIANLQNPQAKLTDDQREYQAARDQGFQGSFMDYMVKMKEAGRQQVNIDTGEKLPSGFRWVNPDQRELGVEPIPGGPATQIPGELAARIGMGENWLQNDLPTLRDPASLEAATGPIDRAMAWAGRGKPAEIERKFQSGVEVLSRLLSGAGMTQIEVDEKTKRYMPTIADDANSLMTKLNQLEAEIRAAGNAAMRGRGGRIEAFPSSGANKPISEMSDQELEAVINGGR